MTLSRNLFIFQVELEVGEELGYILPKIVEAAAFFFCGTACAFGSADEAAYLAHLEQFVLLW